MSRNKEYKELTEKSEKLHCSNGKHCPPPIVSLTGRVSVLEAKQDIMYDEIKTVKKQIWFVLSTIIIGFLTAISLGVLL